MHKSASTCLPTTAPLQAPGLTRRMACGLYEGILLFGVLFTSAALYDHTVMDNRHGRQLFLFIVSGIYFVWFWHKGQTLAMKTWHIRVVDRQGRSLTQARALLRYGLSWLWVLPPLIASLPFGLPLLEITVLVAGWIAVWALASRLHPLGQFWHDALAGTRLVQSPALPPRATTKPTPTPTT